jgi:hypothetical protein
MQTYLISVNPETPFEVHRFFVDERSTGRRSSTIPAACSA